MKRPRLFIKEDLVPQLLEIILLLDIMLVTMLLLVSPNGRQSFQKHSKFIRSPQQAQVFLWTVAIVARKTFQLLMMTKSRITIFRLASEVQSMTLLLKKPTPKMKWQAMICP